MSVEFLTSHSQKQPVDVSNNSSMNLLWRAVVLSALAAVMVAIAVLGVTVRSTQGFAVWSDGLAYFLYARSAVIDRDLYIGDEFDYLDARVPVGSKAMEPLRKWTVRSADGRLISPWPAGAGLLMAPFYAIGYGVEGAVAAVSGRLPDSYGFIPQIAFVVGSVAFGVLGFWCMFFLCRELVQPRIAYLSAIGVALCGPVVFYVLFHPSMAHAPSFGLAALFTLIWLRAWINGTNVRTIIALGLLLGVAATVRYQNALYGALLVALIVKEWGRVGFIAAAKEAVIGLAACLLPLAALMGGQLTLTSGDHGRGTSVAQYPIDFASPYFGDVLLSCRHGAFHWAPLLGIALLGVVVALRHKEGWAGPMLLVFLLQTYLIGGLSLSTVGYSGNQPLSGWLHHWDDAPSFGMRYLTECAPIFALGLAYLIQQTRPLTGLIPWGAAIALAAGWNALLIVAYGLETITRSGCLAYSDMMHGFVMVIGKLVHL